MTKGKITITFDRGITHIIGVEVDGPANDLWMAPVTKELINWWRHSGNDLYTLLLADGSVVMLNRDKILNISLVPDSCLEIK